MPTRRNLMIVIADGEHVRFVRPGSGRTLRTERTIDSIAAHRRSSDLGSDRPGASYHSGSTAHHAFLPRHEPHALEREQFADAVAGLIKSGSGADGFDDLVLAAPPRILAAIRKALDPETDARVIGALAKDLVKTPDHELWTHFAEWVGPPRHARGG